MCLITRSTQHFGFIRPSESGIVYFLGELHSTLNETLVIYDFFFIFF
jgi:hypothetical protein